MKVMGVLQEFQEEFDAMMGKGGAVMMRGPIAVRASTSPRTPGN